jgi:hypothetical protein
VSDKEHLPVENIKTVTIDTLSKPINDNFANHYTTNAAIDMKSWNNHILPFYHQMLMYKWYKYEESI